MNIRVHVLFLIMVAEFDTRGQLLLLYHRLIRGDNARAHGQWPRQKLQGIRAYKLFCIKRDRVTCTACVRLRHLNIYIILWYMRFFD